MDSFSISNIKAEKANAIKKQRQIQKIAGFFRVLEVCLVLAIISRFSIQLPLAVKNSSEYFKGLSLTLASPRFVFVLGNAIVITLFAKSGQFLGQESNRKNSRNDIYEEFIQKSTKSYRNEAKSRGKQSNSVSGGVVKETCASLESKNYQRSLSENDIKRPISPKPSRELRRSSTGMCTKSIDYGEGWVKISFPEDRLSNEEFRSTVEAFIARQKRFRIVEENSVI